VGTDLLPFQDVAVLVATVSTLGIILLLPLYLSQRRDIERLHGWMLQDPSYSATDLALSESRLDKAELELEEIYAERGDPVPGTMEFQALHADELPPELQVTSDRPALDRITMERAALDPHPRWHQFSRRITQPRTLAVIGVLALLFAAAGIIATQGILSDEAGDGGAIQTEPTGIEVAVLNTTSASGLGGKIARDVEQSGFLRGEVGSLARETDQTFVMYGSGERSAARRVAKKLGGVAVQPIDRDVEAAAGGADVVVIVGRDRASG
jgi:hypothetical protein